MLCLKLWYLNEYIFELISHKHELSRFEDQTLFILSIIFNRKELRRVNMVLKKKKKNKNSIENFDTMCKQIVYL